MLCDTSTSTLMMTACVGRLIPQANTYLNDDSMCGQVDPAGKYLP